MASNFGKLAQYMSFLIKLNYHFIIFKDQALYYYIAILIKILDRYFSTKNILDKANSCAKPAIDI